MTTLLPKHLSRFVFMAMLGLVFGAALLAAPEPRFSSTDGFDIGVETVSASLKSAQNPIKQHTVDDCVICKSQTCMGGQAHQPPRVDAFVASVPPRLFVPQHAEARAPPVLETFVSTPPRSFNPRGPPIVG